MLFAYPSKFVSGYTTSPHPFSFSFISIPIHLTVSPLPFPCSSSHSVPFDFSSYPFTSALNSALKSFQFLPPASQPFLLFSFYSSLYDDFLLPIHLCPHFRPIQFLPPKSLPFFLSSLYSSLLVFFFLRARRAFTRLALFFSFPPHPTSCPICPPFLIFFFLPRTRKH